MFCCELPPAENCPATDNVGAVLTGEHECASLMAREASAGLLVVLYCYG